jgi:hypothetical protein
MQAGQLHLVKPYKVALSDTKALRKKYDTILDARCPLPGTRPWGWRQVALSDTKALRKKYDTILDARCPLHRNEAVGMAPLLGITSRAPVHRDEPQVEGLEDVPLSRYLKRLRQGKTRDLESGKRDGQGRAIWSPLGEGREVARHL